MDMFRLVGFLLSFFVAICGGIFLTTAILSPFPDFFIWWGLSMLMFVVSIVTYTVLNKR